ncbi:MAG TPA: DUF72 domain-containing protein [Polyangiales bacterium]|nr:DUF72 domain-containing protein [Polyangiales bacterium]
MISIACSGFPIPASRYFQEFRALEIADTELGLPGSGTLRRWLREATPQFAFSVVAPKQIAGSGFSLEPGMKQAVSAVASFTKQLKGQAVVFAATDDFKPTRPNRSKLRAFAEHAATQIKRPVFDLPAWSRKEAASTLKQLEVYLAFDPLVEAPDDDGFAYARMAGPSGYRSRYDNAALDRVVEHCQRSTAKHTFVAFRNIDCYENSRYVLSRL